jgi:hypothetical protein
MKKVVSFLLAGTLLLSSTTSGVLAAERPRGGFPGFITGCCFGLRMAADYNEIGTGQRDFLSWFIVGFFLGPQTAIDYREGKDIHWRDIGRVLCFIFPIWDAFDGGAGKGRQELRQEYGASYY